MKKSYIFLSFLMVGVFTAPAFAKKVTILRNKDGITRKRVYSGENLKTSTYRLNASASEAGCEAAIQQKANELKDQGFKVIDFDNSECAKPDEPRSDEIEIRILFE